MFRGGSRNVTTSKMECFVIIVNGFQPLTIITKRSILDVAAVLDPPLMLWQQLLLHMLITLCLRLVIFDKLKMILFYLNLTFSQVLSHIISYIFMCHFTFTSFLLFFPRDTKECNCIPGGCKFRY